VPVPPVTSMGDATGSSTCLGHIECPCHIDRGLRITGMTLGNGRM
jgi:hypothetical protein